MNHNDLAQRYLVYRPANKFRWNSIIIFGYDLCVVVDEETRSQTSRHAHCLKERVDLCLHQPSVCLLSKLPPQHHFFAFRSASVGYRLLWQLVCLNIHFSTRIITVFGFLPSSFMRFESYAVCHVVFDAVWFMQMINTRCIIGTKLKSTMAQAVLPARVPYGKRTFMFWTQTRCRCIIPLPYHYFWVRMLQTVCC